MVRLDTLVARDAKNIDRRGTRMARKDLVKKRLCTGTKREALRPIDRVPWGRSSARHFAR